MQARIALEGGSATREKLLPYGRQYLTAEDVDGVVAVLQSNWLTTGPKVSEFEEKFARFVGAKYAIAVSNGTAALHTAMHALGVGPGDEVIVPTMTFAASANCVLFEKALPVLVDITPGNLLLDLEQVVAKITPKTKGIVCVDYAGHPCDYQKLTEIAKQHNLFVLADACHAIGAQYQGQKVGSLATCSTFSFHPVKHMTTGEGGMITTDDKRLATAMRHFRNHGITTTHLQREQAGSWYYEMTDLGYNYRISDFQCALGISQLKKLPDFLEKRCAIAREYDQKFAKLAALTPLSCDANVKHAYHLYVVKLELDLLSVDRKKIFQALRAENIGVNVHYIPVHLHPFYQKTLGTRKGDFPVAEQAYQCILSLPLFPSMSRQDVEDVVTATTKVINYYS